ncbi:MAG TPA: SRPBCC family protein [Streptosporangiaceae bacterium]
MNEFEITIVIERPVENVFAILQDVSKTPAWTPGLTEVRQIGDAPLRVGAQLVYVGSFLGRSYESEASCTEFVANERFASKTTSGPFYLEIDTRLEPVANGTRMATVYRGESHGFFKIAEPIVTRLARKQFETAAVNLKALIEENAL